MDESQVRQLIQEEMSTSNNRAQFEVVPIPAHTHNNVDSNPVDASNITNLDPVHIARVFSVTGVSSPVPIGTTTDLYDLPNVTGALSFSNPTGLPLINGQMLRVRITSSNTATARALSWSSSTGGYNGGSLPSATTTGQTLDLGFQYDTTNSLNKWRLVYSSSSAAIPVLSSGTYTPTLTAVANVSASTAYVCQYLRVGNTVTVSGEVDVDPTTGVSTTTQLGISLPVESNFASATQCAGTACSPSIATQSGGIYADGTNDRAQLDFKAADPNNTVWYFHFTYLII